MKTNEGNSLLWGASVAGAPFGPRGSVAWVPVLGLSAAVGSGCLLRTYRTSTTTQQHHNPYSNSVYSNPYSNSVHSNFSFHPTHPTIRIISRILGDLGPRACLISYHESPSYSLHKKGGNKKADHPNHTGLGISLIVTKEIIPIIRE